MEVFRLLPERSQKTSLVGFLVMGFTTRQLGRPMFTGLFRSPACSRFSSFRPLGSFPLSFATTLPTARVRHNTAYSPCCPPGPSLTHPMTSHASSSGLISTLYFPNIGLSMATFLYSSPCSYWLFSRSYPTIFPPTAHSSFFIIFSTLKKEQWALP
jgi:hypothetical protein